MRTIVALIVVLACTAGGAALAQTAQLHARCDRDAGRAEIFAFPFDPDATAVPGHQREGADWECTLPGGVSVRLKTRDQPRWPAGMCGTDPWRAFSLWVNRRKVISNLTYDTCYGTSLRSIEITRDTIGTCEYLRRQGSSGYPSNDDER